jgi:hypothetical protein
VIVAWRLFSYYRRCGLPLWYSLKRAVRAAFN